MSLHGDFARAWSMAPAGPAAVAGWRHSRWRCWRWPSSSGPERKIELHLRGFGFARAHLLMARQQRSFGSEDGSRISKPRLQRGERQYSTYLRLAAVGIKVLTRRSLYMPFCAKLRISS